MSEFVWKDSDITISQCIRCKHKQRDNKCAAFPKRIPMEILTNEFDHRERYPGDSGVRFQLAVD